MLKHKLVHLCEVISHAHTHSIKLIMQHRWEILSSIYSERSWKKSCNIRSKLFCHWICWAPSPTASNMAIITLSSQIGEHVVNSACNVLGQNEVALHAGATEDVTSRSQEWRGKSNLCRHKDISKHVSMPHLAWRMDKPSAWFYTNLVYCQDASLQ